MTENSAILWTEVSDPEAIDQARQRRQWADRNSACLQIVAYTAAHRASDVVDYFHTVSLF
jgi:hypothetical protein